MKKALIYSIREQLTHGAFGQVMTWVLEILPYLENEGYLPENVSWDIHTLGYKQIIPGMFLPKTAGVNEGPCTYFNLVNLKFQHSHNFGFTDKSFQAANDIFSKWFDIPEIILEHLPVFPENDMTLGLHYRGTDKIRDSFEANPLTMNEFIMLAKDLLASRDFNSIFVCSDEAEFPDRVRKFFSNMEVIEIEQFRSRDGSPLHVKGAKSAGSLCRENMLNVLRDVIALSKCTTLLKCSSALSAWAKIINPKCEVYQVSAMKQPWFPGGAILPYAPRTDIAKAILRRSMQGDNMTNRLA